MFGVALLGAVLALTVGRGTSSTWTTVETTFTPADAEGLACVGQVGEVRCALDGQGAPVPTPTPPLRPFVTTGGELVLFAGVFESPKVASWLERARGTEVRVHVRCAAKLLTRSVQVRLRFRSTDPLGPREVPAFTVKDCEPLR
jgi:hypothetical protein